MNKDIDLNNLKQNFHQFDQDEVNALFMHCCKAGHLSAIKFMFKEPDLPFRPDIDYTDDYYDGLTQAAANGYLDIVDYLLYSKDLDKNPIFNRFYYDYLALICEQKNFNVADYLLKKEIFDPETAFIESHYYTTEPSSLTHYLVINCNVKITPEIQTIIDDKPLIAEVFMLRELNKELKQNLTGTELNNKKFKL